MLGLSHLISFHYLYVFFPENLPPLTLKGLKWLTLNHILPARLIFGRNYNPATAVRDGGRDTMRPRAPLIHQKKPL